MIYRRSGVRRAGRKSPARKGVRGRKNLARRRQSVRQQSRGLPKRQTLQSSLGGLSLTRYVSTRKPNTVAKFIKNSGSPNYINITYPGIIYGEGGTQAFSSWYLNTAGDLQRIWASIQALNVARNAVSGALVSGAGSSTNQSFRYVLESALSMLHLANTSGTPLNVELYDICAKRDSPQRAFDLSGNLLAFNISKGTGILDPSTAWFLGMQNQQSIASGFASATGFQPEKSDPTNLGATPYQSKLFKDYFKVLRKTNVSIPIGGQHKHHVDLKPNAIIDGDMMSQNAIYRGLSFFTLIVVSGVPVVACPGNGTQEGAGADVATSAVSLSVIQSVKYKWTWVEDTRENVYLAQFINLQNTNTFTSVQPSLVKVNNATEWMQQSVNPTANQYVSLPSECTR